MFGQEITYISMILLTGIAGGLFGASFIPGSVKGGVLGTLLLGIMGALLGSLVAMQVGYESGEINTATIIFASLGALFLGVLHKTIFRENNQFRAG